MDYAVIVVPAAPVRRKPRHQTEMVSQLLFGEMVQIIKVKDSFWVKIRSLHDNYEGWLTHNLIQPVSKKQGKTKREFVAADYLNTLLFNEKIMNVPMGSSLLNLTNGKGNLGDIEYSFAGNHLNRFSQRADGELIKQLTFKWLNAPYMWGGRTILGVDCSGFVQVNFKMIGLDLPRDAWQQAKDGKRVKNLKDAQAGDLAFFDDDDEIVHVGILLNNEQIIHASGKVRIDPIDRKGIINIDTEKRTHSLLTIKRHW